jgi:phosphoenolpyruvate carboxylase
LNYLIWNLQRIDRMIVAVIRHMHLPAVAGIQLTINGISAGLRNTG